jgi:hypothetical protein
LLARSEVGDEGRVWKEISQEVHKDADRLFKMIGEAYAVLSDTAKVVCMIFSLLINMNLPLTLVCKCELDEQGKDRQQIIIEWLLYTCSNNMLDRNA